MATSLAENEAQMETLVGEDGISLFVVASQTGVPVMRSLVSSYVIVAPIEWILHVYPKQGQNICYTIYQVEGTSFDHLADAVYEEQIEVLVDAKLGVFITNLVLKNRYPSRSTKKRIVVHHTSKQMDICWNGNNLDLIDSEVQYLDGCLSFVLE